MIWQGFVIKNCTQKCFILRVKKGDLCLNTMRRNVGTKKSFERGLLKFFPTSTYFFLWFFDSTSYLWWICEASRAQNSFKVLVLCVVMIFAFFLSFYIENFFSLSRFIFHIIHFTWRSFLTHSCFLHLHAFLYIQH